MPRKTSSASSKKTTAKRSSAKSGSRGGSNSSRKSSSRRKTSTRKSTAKRSNRSRAEDRSRINVHQRYEVAYWSENLGVTPAQLKKLVSEHGTSAVAVRKAVASTKKRSRSADRSEINVHQPYELRYWTKALSITGDRLKELVKEHGPSAEGIRSALGLS
jgi:hypothetical protein